MTKVGEPLPASVVTSNAHLPVTSWASAAVESSATSNTVRIDVNILDVPPFRRKPAVQREPLRGGFTRTFICAFDQQHWKPRPPSPDQSLATKRKVYSPASLKVAEVCAFPVNLAEGGA